MSETTYDVYRRRYTVDYSSQHKPAEVEAEVDPLEAALREEIHVLKHKLVIAEAELAAAERSITNR